MIQKNDTRLIEHGFPCHQVGAETQRERGASSALPPLYYLHVWWARRPLTPSRAAILASLLPADTDPEEFVRSLGIEKCVALVQEQQWTLTGKLLERIQTDDNGREYLPVDRVVLRALDKEQHRRQQNRELIAELKSKDAGLQNDPVLVRWEQESQPLPEPWPDEGARLELQRVMGDPAWFKQLMALSQSRGVRVPNLYGYDRAFSNITTPAHDNRNITILDPTSGGGSIPFEALRLGYSVIANELNPVASVILYATLQYPAQFGSSLIDDVRIWGEELINHLDKSIGPYFSKSAPLPVQEDKALQGLHCQHKQLEQFEKEQVTTYLYCRQVTCPHCRGEAPLLNSCWLSKEDGKQWGVRIVSDGKSRKGTVRFETYKVQKGRGPQGDDPEFSTVSGGVGQCIHCRQGITGEEIKAQARGESPLGKWQDRLYCVVAVRQEPILDKEGRPQRYASGEKQGQIKTRKIRFFRPPNDQDLQALRQAEEKLNEKWDEWAAKDYIPTEQFPPGNDMRPVYYGMPRWCDMFTPRQLLGHCTLVEGLNELKPRIIEELGQEKGRAVITYLQFAIDKGVDYNSRQTRWEYTRGIVKGNFGRHDFSLKWTFGEMIFTGPNSGLKWCFSQIYDAYQGLAHILSPVHEQYYFDAQAPQVSITNHSADSISQVQNSSVDLVVMDPPYYNNVQYAELSDFFYVWQKRTLKDLYPGFFSRRLTNKNEEAVANPARDGSAQSANDSYIAHMSSIFAECRRVLKEAGLLTLMFTHKSQNAWEALTRSLIETGWIITGTFPVESESSASMHQKDMAAAASSIFISCRKRTEEAEFPAVWTGIGGRGVQKQIQEAVEQGLEEFIPLRLNPVDEMVASYGRALKVLSQNWPVMDGDEEVSPIRAMNEASRVVAENQIARLSRGRIQVSELDSETAMALTIFGIWGLKDFAYDEGLNLSRSLQVRLAEKNGGYQVQDNTIGLSSAARGRARQRQANGANGFHAPLVKNGSKLRLAAPRERNEKRLENPQTEWDVLQGMLRVYDQGDILMVRPYLEKHAGDSRNRMLDLLRVWAAEVDDPDMRRKAEIILFGLQS
ncbi:DUF1156 domain-containing protein [Desulfonatronospira sp.]|uniref:DUF1156 domain-containing protein n=1 Tax=Desulfonatronospira sp. TaxID=1962951 RepID=UPI0025BD277A|nr:DUF1156 domain-containing protein [Desulfonatronospira sp.]